MLLLRKKGCILEHREFFQSVIISGTSLSTFVLKLCGGRKLLGVFVSPLKMRLSSLLFSVVIEMVFLFFFFLTVCVFFT